MPKFTGGRWVVRSSGVFCSIYNEWKVFICDVSDGAMMETREANARLIAKAPEAYHLIKRLTHAAIHMHAHHCTCADGIECLNCQDVKAIADYLEEVDHD